MNRLIISFLLISLLLGTSLVIMSNHWFPIWLGLELSTLALIPLINVNINTRSNEATIKYFLVQAFSAALLLNSATINLWLSNSWDLSNISNTPICYIISSFAIIIKLGLAPCHFWFPDVLSGLSFKSGIIIACWQKIAPLFLLLSLANFINNEIILLCATASVLIGGWGGLNQTSIRKILAYSSISHLGWISATLFFLPEASLALFIFYLINNLMIFLLCDNNKLFFLSNLNKINIFPMNTILLSIALLSLGGLPPLGGFLNKLIPLLIFSNNSNISIIIIFIIGSLISLYFYLRLVFNTSLTLFPQHSINIIYPNINNNNNIIISILSPFSIWGLLLIPMFFVYI
uniref:NADH-ubiquinone oxidoreductase chain 2 n=1 Tax=Phyllophorella liuwutiensis TaxID=2810320 RepID=A0A890VVS4_9ECHN|nr:NADH dehydrogenase subunit 2 [Phyllophorella liuwutiensis]QRI59061.1 NADH dehydrogenase subunit 2 [Phyllophorella liuwutiensis]